MRHRVPAEALDAFKKWQHDPVAFVKDVWPGTKLEDFQAEALRALATHDRVSIRSGHGVGKSALDSWAVLWFMCCGGWPAKVPITAPTAHQLDDILWPEIGSWLRRMPLSLEQQFVLKADRLVLKADPTNSFAAFRTGNRANPDALQGFHSDNILFILDEASGIADEVFVVAEGALSTPGAKVLMTGNPTRASGYFYDSHHSQRQHWYTMSVPCTSSSRVAPEYVERMKRFGENSNVYRVRVLGEFPKSDDDAVIPLEWAEMAVHRSLKLMDVDPVWGLDVARFGDDRSALAKRQGNVLLEPIKTWRNLDTMQVAGRVLMEYNSAKRKPSAILVDVIGIGAGVVDRLKEMGVPVRGINVSERPSVDGRYMRYRDELWFRGREWFEGLDVRIPKDDELIGELCTVSYEITPGGKIQVQSKEKMKREGKPSPDLADAFLLTFAELRYPTRKSWQPLQYDTRAYV
jgi:hypothetical protein